MSIVRFVSTFYYTNDLSFKSSFDTLLKLHEVIRFGELIAIFADTRTEIPGDEGQVGFCYDTAGRSAVLGGRWWRILGGKPVQPTGETVRVCDQDRPQPAIVLILPQYSQEN